MKQATEMETKKCSKCAVIFPVSDFGYSGIAKDRLRHMCKKCTTNYSQSDSAKTARNKSKLKRIESGLIRKAEAPIQPPGTVSMIEATHILRLSQPRLSELIKMGSIDAIRGTNRVWPVWLSVMAFRPVGTGGNPNGVCVLSKTVYQFNIEGELIGTFDSIALAAKANGKHRATIKCAIDRCSVVSRRYFFSHNKTLSVSYADDSDWDDLSFV